MNYCIPIVDDHGLDSRVSGHFGSAPRFLLLDPGLGTTRVLENVASHVPGRCSSLAVLRGEHLDAVMVGGIGEGALKRLGARGVRVYDVSGLETARDVIAALRAGRLEELASKSTCVHGHAAGPGQRHGGKRHGNGRGRGGCGHH